MLRVDKPAENRINLHLSGRLNAAGMRDGLEALIAASEGVRGGQLYYVISDLAWPSLAALLVEIRKLPQLLPLIRRFERCAVVSDRRWLRRAAEIEGRLIPGLTIRAFPSQEAAAAEAWLTAKEVSAGCQSRC